MYMPKLVIVSSLTILFSLLLIPATAGALSPSMKVFECWSAESQSSECEQILCEWENTERNWPEDTGFYQDCSGSFATKVKDNYLIYLVPVALLAVGSAWFVARRRKAQS